MSLEVQGAQATAVAPVWAQGQPARPAGRPRQILAVGGGKGGIGKSLISTNLALHLAQLGRRVVLVDADLGGANLHTCLGMAPPRRTLSDFVRREVAALADVLAPTGHANLSLISGALDAFGAADPRDGEKVRLLREIAQLDVDTVLIDLGGGTGHHTIDFFLLAHHGLITVVPEPTSVENAYRFIKAACSRRLWALEAVWGTPREEASRAAEGGARSPRELLLEDAKRDPQLSERMRAELGRFPLSLVVNQVRTAEEYALGPAMGTACRTHLGVDLRFVGAVPYDDAVWRAVRRRRPVLLDSPESPASRHLRDVVVAMGLAHEALRP